MLSHVLRWLNRIRGRLGAAFAGAWFSLRAGIESRWHAVLAATPAVAATAIAIGQSVGRSVRRRLRRGVFTARRSLTRALRLFIHWLVYAFAVIAMSASVLFFFSPFVFIGELTAADGSRNQHRAGRSYLDYAVWPIGWIFESAGRSMPHEKCTTVSRGDSNPPHPCEAGVAGDKPASVLVTRFDTIFHAVFAVCVGVGVIFEAGELARGARRRLKRDIRRALQQDGNTVAGEPYSPGRTFLEWFEVSTRRFEVLVLWGMGITTLASYICFLVSALLAGILLAVTPWHENLVIRVDQINYYYAYVLAPFVSAFALIVFVLMIDAGRLAYTARINSRATWIRRENDLTRAELLDALNR